MWIFCLADDLHEMPSRDFFEKKKKKKKNIKKKFRMLSAKILLSTLRVNTTRVLTKKWKIK